MIFVLDGSSWSLVNEDMVSRNVFCAGVVILVTD